MKSLWLYSWLSRVKFMNYRTKIMVVAFAGTHIPLIAIVGNIAWQSSSDWQSFLGVLGTALAATLGGTAVTLFVLIHLLRPVVATSKALRTYRETRAITPLPTDFVDEVGTLMANTVMTLTNLEDARDKLENFDPATGLANREKISKDIAAAGADQIPFHVCVVTFNSYDRITRAMDVATAESAVGTIGTRLASFLGARVELARISPHQFAFIRPHDVQADPDGSDAVRSLEQLLGKSGASMKLGQTVFQPSLSGGVAQFPNDSTSAEQLLDFAAAATAFTGHRSPAAAYIAQDRADALDRFQIEEDLKSALANDEFELHYQPVVAADQRRAVGAEALIRWNHATSGLIRPDHFIPVAEESGLITEIGLWVMDTACRQAATWNATGQSKLKVAINLSAKQFHDPALVSHVKSAIDHHKISGDQLEIELTESSLMDDFDQSRIIFGKLRDQGVNIAIDDFGTGFASLSYLRRLPFDKLKLDREFVTNIDTTKESQAICSALIALAHGLGLKVLAEGTERENEIRYLRDQGCDLFQGYYLSKPVPADAFARAIESSRIVSLIDRTTTEHLKIA